MKEFNVTGTCIPNKHYMVDISHKLDEIEKLVDKEQYFTMNRARQYGKTTTLAALHRRLKDKYDVIRLSFEGVAEQSFSSNESFVRMFIRKTKRELEYIGLEQSELTQWEDVTSLEKQDFMDPFELLSEKISRLCKDKQYVLIVDEIDKSSDNQVFLNFLGMLRCKYLERVEERDTTFRSVILAGVYDIKNLKLKIRPNDEKKYNSPWNVAVDFKVDMSFSPEEIQTMLQEYEADYHIGMDIPSIAKEIYFYTNGYPVLVSRMCKWIDEDGNREWTIENLRNAEKAILKTRNTLFDDLIKNIENNEELKALVIRLLYDGHKQIFSLADPIIELGCILGIFIEKDHSVAISNLIYETYLYDYVVSTQIRKDDFINTDRNQFINHNQLDMVRVLDKFQELMKAEYRKEDEKFLEKHGRLLFLCFLKPIINGTGFYYVEPQTRNNTRMDIVVVYGNKEYIIELKIWKGTQYREDGIKQLNGYLDSRNNKEGYLVSFSFLKDKKYFAGYIEDQTNGNRIYEIII